MTNFEDNAVKQRKVRDFMLTGAFCLAAATAATEGLLELLTPQEIEGVWAHEMSHVRHYDILIGSVAAMFAGAIAMLGNAARMSGAG